MLAMEKLFPKKTIRCLLESQICTTGKQSIGICVFQRCAWLELYAFYSPSPCGIVYTWYWHAITYILQWARSRHKHLLMSDCIRFKEVNYSNRNALRWSYDLGVTVHCESWNDHWNTCCNCKSSWMDSSPLLRPLLLGCNRERSYRCSKRLKTGCSFVHRRGCTRVIVRRSDGPCGCVTCLAHLLLSAMLLDWPVCF